jgi:pentatricopeptide repeat protein
MIDVCIQRTQSTGLQLRRGRTQAVLLLVIQWAASTFGFVMPMLNSKPRCSQQHCQLLINAHPCKATQNVHQDSQPSPHYLSSATPYNKDIARTLFPRFFFSLDRNNSTTSEQHERNVSRYPSRPCPFQDPSSAQTSERMLRRMMENRYQSDGRTVCPDAATFNLVSGAFGRLRYHNQRGEDDEKVTSVIWKEEPKVNPAHRSNIEHRYNQILLRDSKSDMKRLSNKEVVMTPVIKLQELLELQLQLCHYEGWPKALCPSVNTYNRILKRLGGKSPYDAKFAWEIFQFMQSPLPGTADSHRRIVCEPNGLTCLHVIRVLSLYRPERAIGYTSSKAMIQSMGDMSSELGIEMIPHTIPDNVSTDWFLNEAEKTLDVLRDKCNTMRKGPERDEATTILALGTSALLEGWGKYAVSHGNLTSSSPFLQKREQAISRSHELLLSLEELSKTEGGIVRIPSSSYTSVILGLSVSNKASEAEEILDRMLLQSKSSTASFDPHDISTAYSACIAAYAKVNDARKAEKILHQMIELYDSNVLGDEFVPDSRAYGTCIAAWAKYEPGKTSNDGIENRERHSMYSHHPNWQQRVKNADNAERILYELERLIDSERAKGNTEFVVHATPYNIAIHARVQVS